jgi:hypothetical protein
MSNITWTGTTSGNWTDAADWSSGAVPGASDNVSIGVAGITVTVSTAGLAASSLTTTLSAFDVTGGELDIGNFASFGGSYAQSGGLLQLAGNGGSFNDGLALNGGAISLLSGTLSTAGTLSLSGGAIDQSGGTLLFEAATSLSGAGTIDSTNGGLDALSSVTMSSGLMLFESNSNGANFYGDVTQTGGSIDLAHGGLTTYANFVEDGGSMLLNWFGGTFLGTTSLLAGTITSTAATMTVDGAYSQTGGLLALGGRGAVFAGPMTLGTGGTITLVLGALQTEGVASLAGTISGAGTLLVDGGTTTLASGIHLSLPHVDVQAGTLALASSLKSLTLGGAFWLESPGTLALATDTLNLSAAGVLDGEIAGHGTLNANAGATLNGLAIDDATVLDLYGTSKLVNYIFIGSGVGSTAEVNVERHASLLLTGNDTIYDNSSKGTLANSGVIEKTAGSGMAVVDANLTSIGYIEINVGSLELAGRTTSMRGVIEGAGRLVLDSLDTTLVKGIDLTVSEVELIGNSGGGQQTHLGQDLSYANLWDQEGGTLVLSHGATLALSGLTSLEGGLISGAGTIATTTHVNVDAIDIEGPSVLSVAGTATQTGTTDLGASAGLGAEISIATGASWFIEQDSSIFGTNGTILNDGLFSKRNGSAVSTITSTLDSVGTVSIGNGTLALAGRASLGGTVSGAGVLELAGTVALASGLVLTAAQTDIGGSGNNALVTLGGNLADSHAFSVDSGNLQLDGNTLTLSGLTVLDGGLIGGQGTPSGGEIVTSGSLVLSGTANNSVSIGPSASLYVGGPAEQVNSLVLGDPQSGYGAGIHSLLQIDAGTTYTLDGGANIEGNGTLSVLGTLSLPDDGANTISAAVVNSGLIQAGNAQLTFAGGLSGAGTITVGANGLATFDNAVSSSATVAMSGSGASLLIERPVGDPGGIPDPLSFAGTISGFASNDFIELGELNANSSSLSFTVSGDSVSITDGQNVAVLNFTSPQGSLSLGHAGGYLALIHG